MFFFSQMAGQELKRGKCQDNSLKCQYSRCNGRPLFSSCRNNCTYSLVDVILIATTLPGLGQHYKLYMCFYAWTTESNTILCIISNFVQRWRMHIVTKYTLIFVTFQCQGMPRYAQVCPGMPRYA